MICDFCHMNEVAPIVLTLQTVETLIEYRLCRDCETKILDLRKRTHKEQLEYILSALAVIHERVLGSDIVILRNKVQEFQNEL